MLFIVDQVAVEAEVVAEAVFEVVVKAGGEIVPSSIMYIYYNNYYIFNICIYLKKKLIFLSLLPRFVVRNCL